MVIYFAGAFKTEVIVMYEPPAGEIAWEYELECTYNTNVNNRPPTYKTAYFKINPDWFFAPCEYRSRATLMWIVDKINRQLLNPLRWEEEEHCGEDISDYKPIYNYPWSFSLEPSK